MAEKKFPKRPTSQPTVNRCEYGTCALCNRESPMCVRVRRWLRGRLSREPLMACSRCRLKLLYGWEVDLEWQEGTIHHDTNLTQNDFMEWAKKNPPLPESELAELFKDE
jgi:hypothetical protein